MTYAIGRRMFDASVGWLAAIALASSLMFCVAARAATPDSVLIFCCTLAYWFYVRAVFREGSVVDGAFAKYMTQWVPFYASLGLAVLAKGPIGFLIPMAVVGMFMLIQRADSSGQSIDGKRTWIGSIRNWLGWFGPLHFLRTLLAMRIFAGVAVMLVVALPWYLAVHFQTDGEFTRRFFLTENFARASGAMESHSGGIWFYPLAILLGFFPWSVFVVPTIRWVCSGGDGWASHRSAITFLIGWVVIQVVTFSLFGTKLPSYVTPCYPALAILTAAALMSFARSLESKQSDSAAQWYLKAASIVLAIVGAAIAAGLCFGMHKLFGDLQWLGLLGIVLVAGGVFSYRFAVEQRVDRYIWTIAVSAAIFCSGLFGLATVAVDGQNSIRTITDKISANGSSAVASWRSLEPSWVFYGGKPVHELVPPASNAEAYQPYFSRDSFWQRKPPMTPAQFIERHPKAYILTTNEHIEELQTLLPGKYVTVEEIDYFLKKDRKLILLGRE
jgi:4-amino-4-deoxy-L-arabinose transferase-like glycosyltransferase